MNIEEANKIIDVLRSLIVEELPLPPPPTSEPEVSTTLAKFPYLTVNGVRPPEPVSFFHTKAFLCFGAAFAVGVGTIMYFMLFA